MPAWAIPDGGPVQQRRGQTVDEGDTLFIEWNCTTSDHRVEDGIDTFIFRDGLIRL